MNEIDKKYQRLEAQRVEAVKQAKALKIIIEQQIGENKQLLKKIENNLKQPKWMRTYD